MARHRNAWSNFFVGEGLEVLVARLAKPRKARKKSAAAIREAYDGTLGPELCRWTELMDAFAMEKAMRPMEPRAPHLDDLSALVGKSRRAEWIAELQGFFCGVSIIAQDDETSYQAAWEPFPDGACQVVYAHQDQWGAVHVDRSITSWLFWKLHLGGEEAEEASRLQMEGEEASRLEKERESFSNGWPAKGRGQTELELFHHRTLWLTRVFTGMGGEWTELLDEAATYEDWQRERALARQRPNLAAYWLWSHWLLQNDADLDELLRSSAQLKHPVVRETRSVLERLRKGKAIKLAGLDRTHFEGVREEIADVAPASLLSPDRKQRGPKKSIEDQTRALGEKALLANLKKAAEADPKLADSLKWMELLEVNQTDILAWSRAGSSEDEAAARLLELVDTRHRPLLEAKLATAAKYKDDHKKVVPGLLRALAKVSPSFEEFEAFLKRSGTANYGSRRKEELAAAYATFDHPKATAWLEKRARDYVKAMFRDTRQTKEPVEAFRAFIRCNLPSAHELLATFLEKVEVDGGSWYLCAEAAERAGELGLPIFSKGLARMFEEDLGVNDTPMRAALSRAYARVAPAAARTLLGERWQEASANGYEHEQCAALSGLLICAPREYQKHAAPLLESARAARPSEFHPAMPAAILRGIAASPERSLAELAHPWQIFTKERVSKDVRQRLQALAREAVERCGRPQPNR